MPNPTYDDLQKQVNNLDNKLENLTNANNFSPKLLARGFEFSNTFESLPSEIFADSNSDFFIKVSRCVTKAAEMVNKLDSDSLSEKTITDTEGALEIYCKMLKRIGKHQAQPQQPIQEPQQLPPESPAQLQQPIQEPQTTNPQRKAIINSQSTLVSYLKNLPDVPVLKKLSKDNDNEFTGLSQNTRIPLCKNLEPIFAKLHEASVPKAIIKESTVVLLKLSVAITKHKFKFMACSIFGDVLRLTFFKATKTAIISKINGADNSDLKNLLIAFTVEYAFLITVSTWKASDEVSKFSCPKAIKRFIAKLEKIFGNMDCMCRSLNIHDNRFPNIDSQQSLHEFINSFNENNAISPENHKRYTEFTRFKSQFTILFIHIQNFDRLFFYYSQCKKYLDYFKSILGAKVYQPTVLEATENTEKMNLILAKLKTIIDTLEPFFSSNKYLFASERNAHSETFERCKQLFRECSNKMPLLILRIRRWASEVKLSFFPHAIFQNMAFLDSLFASYRLLLPKRLTELSSCTDIFVLVKSIDRLIKYVSRDNSLIMALPLKECFPPFFPANPNEFNFKEGSINFTIVDNKVIPQKFNIFFTSTSTSGAQEAVLKICKLNESMEETSADLTKELSKLRKVDTSTMHSLGAHASTALKILLVLAGIIAAVL